MMQDDNQLPEIERTGTAGAIEAAVASSTRVASLAKPPANAVILEYIRDTACALASHPHLHKAQSSLPIDALHVAAIAAEQFAHELCSNACASAAKPASDSTTDGTMHQGPAIGIRNLSAPALYFELSRLVQSKSANELASFDAAALRVHLRGAFGGADAVSCSDAVLRKYFVVALEEHQMRESINKTASRVGL